MLPPLWVSRLGDCQVTAADTALGIRARLRAPRPPHTTSVHAVPHATCLSSRRPLWSLHLSFPSDARSHSPALGEACAFLFLPTSCRVPEGRGGEPSLAPAAEGSWGVAGLTLWPSVGTACGAPALRLLCRVLVIAARGHGGPSVSGPCSDLSGCGVAAPWRRRPRPPDRWQGLALLSGAPSWSP